MTMNSLKQRWYLAHPWAFNPDLSFQNAVKWTRQLREQGLLVFSPILHSHGYWRELTRQKDYTAYLKAEDWLAWDLGLLDGLANGDAPNWLCADCHQRLDGDFYCLSCDIDWTEQYPEVYPENEQLYDTGVTVLLDEAACRAGEKPMIQTSIYEDERFFKWLWLSDGCRQEYEHAKKKSIRVLSLQAKLRGEEVEL